MIPSPNLDDRSFDDIVQEAMRLILGYGFRELNMHRIELTVFDYNEPAMKLYEKLGFTREGTSRERLRRDGTWYDMHQYAMLEDEWKG